MSMPRSIAVLKNGRKFARVFLFLHKEIDAFLFSGPEQFFNGAPMISPLADRIDFSMPNRWILTGRPIEVLKNGRPSLANVLPFHMALALTLRFSFPQLFLRLSIPFHSSFPFSLLLFLSFSSLPFS